MTFIEAVHVMLSGGKIKNNDISLLSPNIDNNFRYIYYDQFKKDIFDDQGRQISFHLDAILNLNYQLFLDTERLN